MASGKFITFEGGEGSGKSTQVQLLAARLRSTGIDVVATREPGGSPFAEQIRALLLEGTLAPHSALAEALLFNAARTDLLETTIRPALADGRWVICDRFADSTRVYQGVAGGLAMVTLGALERLIVGKSTPDLTVMLDLDPATGLTRARARRAGAGKGGSGEDDPFERRDLGFHQRLRAGYLSIAKAEPGRCVVIDGATPPAQIATAIWAEVERRLVAGAG